MKKILLALTAVVCMASFSFTQDKKAKAREAAPAAKPAEVKKSAPAAKPAVTTGKMKADGTPDMRFKENKAKAAAPVAGPVKKDGTPDMRYKANKAAAKKKG